MADVAQLPELKRRLQASVVKVRDHEAELTRVETDHPTGDLPVNICTRLEQIERSLVRNTGLYRENVKLYEDRLRDAGEETPLDALYKELSDTLEMIDRCHGLINIYRRRDPAIKRGSTPPPGPLSALGGSARAPDPLKDLIKLPPQELATFSGVYSDWPSFWDHYNTTVHSRPALNKVLKMSYLRQSLSGDPFDLVKTLQVTEANYDTAIALLQSRYAD